MPNLVKTEQYKGVMPLIDELNRTHSVQKLNDLIENQIRPTYSEAVKELETTLKRPLHPGEPELAFQYSGGEPMPLRAANPNATPVQLLAEEWANAGGVPKEYNRLSAEIQKIADLKAKSMADRQAAEEMVGVPISKTLSEETGKYIPKIMEDPAKQTFVDRLFGRGKGGKSKEIDPNLSYDKSAEYKLWVDPETGGLETQGMLRKEGTGVMSTPEGTVLNPKWLPGDPLEDKWLRNKTFSTQEGIPVEPWNAPLADVMAAAPYRKALTDPLEAFRRGIAKDEAKTKFMELTRGLENQGLAVPTTARMQKEAPYPTTKTAITDVGAGSREFPNLIPEGHRIADVAGMEGYSVPKGLANYLENAYGIDEGALTKFRHGAGKPLEDLNFWFRNNVLPFFPAWMLGNLTSSAELAVNGGMNLRSLPGAAYKTGRTIYGDEKAMSMIPGVLNKEAKAGLSERGVLTDTWSELNDKLARKQSTEGSMGSGLSASLEDSGQYGGKMRRFSEVLAENEHPTLGKIAGIGADVGEFINRQGKRGFWLGGQGESLTRSAQAMDYIKQGYPNFAKLPQAEKAAIWDEAVRHANEKAVNYNVTPFERNIKNLAVPFYPWLKGSVVQATRTLATHPERIQKMQHVLSNFMLPMSDEEKEGMTDDEKNAMLIRTVFGHTLQNKDPNTGEMLPAYMNIGRFRPYQTPLQLAGIRNVPDALKVVASGLTPNLKGVAEEGLGRTFFGDKLLDETMLKSGSPGAGPTLARDKFFGQPIGATTSHLISSSPGGRILSQAQAPYNYLHSKLYTDPITGLGIPGDPNKPEHGNFGDMFLNQLVGGKIKTINTDAKNRSQDYTYDMEKRRLEQALKQAQKLNDYKAEAIWKTSLDRLKKSREEVRERRGLKGYTVTY
jgi:hypothetical protein